MTMTPRSRKLALAVHLVFSVGWIGAVIAFLALVVAAMTSQDDRTLRGAWIAMELTGRFAIVPLAIGSLITGVIMGLGTQWGLLRHYWVLISLVLTILATAILLGNMQAVSFFARIAAEPGGGDVRDLRGGLRSELVHAGVGLLVLLAIQVLNVYKPQGLTPYGRRQQREQATASPRTEAVAASVRAARWPKVLGISVLVLGLLFIVLHLTGHGPRGHTRPMKHGVQSP